MRYAEKKQLTFATCARFFNLLLCDLYSLLMQRSRANIYYSHVHYLLLIQRLRSCRCSIVHDYLFQFKLTVIYVSNG